MAAETLIGRLEKVLKTVTLPNRFHTSDVHSFMNDMTPAQMACLMSQAKNKGLIKRVGFSHKKAIWQLNDAVETPHRIVQEPPLGGKRPSDTNPTHPFDIMLKHMADMVGVSVDEKLREMEERLLLQIHEHHKNLRHHLEIHRVREPELIETLHDDGHTYGNPPKVKKHRVLLVGGLTKQTNHLLRDYGSRLDLRTEKELCPNLADKAKNVDTTIGWTNFMDHKTDYLLKNNVDNYVRVTGGLSAIRHVLDSLVKESA